MFKLPSEEAMLLKRLSDSLENRKFHDARLNGAPRLAFIRSVEVFLAQSIIDADPESSGSAEKIALILDKSKDTSNEYGAMRQYVKCMALILVVGYFQAISFDSKSDNLVEFGFERLGEKFGVGLLAVLQDNVSAEASTSRLEAGFNVKLRTCSAGDYFSCASDVDKDGKRQFVGLYLEDIHTIYNLVTADVEDGYNRRMLDALRSSTDVDNMIDGYRKNIEAVYNLLFSAGFGIVPYAGVFALCMKTRKGDKQPGFLTIKDDAFESSVLSVIPGTLAMFGERVRSKIGSVSVSDKRQFDYAEIYGSNDIIYYPRKIAEYAFGRETTINTPLRYKVSSYATSWETYSTQYVFPNVRNILLRGVYHALEHLEQKSFVDEDFIHEDCEEYVTMCVTDPDLLDGVKNLLFKLSQSMTTAFILTKWSAVGGKKLAEVALKISAERGVTKFSSEVSSTEDLFKNFTGVNNKEQFDAPVYVSVGESTSAGKSVSVDIFEYQYLVDEVLAGAEPLFGYKVQQANAKRGQAASWSNILIGRGLTGEELYARGGKHPSKIPMQNTFIHNIYAGSRAGKGVMTMNILVSALASGKAIFYLDRKPDMASMMYELSGGGMFTVNGGQYLASEDSYKKFNPDENEAMATWNNQTLPWLRANPKIAELFGVPDLHYGSMDGGLGDYVYFRACMFCLGLCVVRTGLRNVNDELRNKLGGDNGFVLVIDEFNNAQGGMRQILLNEKSALMQAALKMGSVESILEKVKVLEKEIGRLERDMDEETNSKKRNALSDKLEDKRKELESCYDEQGLYAATLYTKITDSFRTWSGLTGAGFRNQEFNYTDIFVLGQKLTCSYLLSSASVVHFPVTLNDNKTGYRLHKQYAPGCDFIRCFLEDAGERGQEDWFFGANLADSCLNNLTEEHKIRKHLSEKVRGWGYFGTKKLTDMLDTATSVPDPVLFKSYLVLNTAMEQEDLSSTAGPIDIQHKYVLQCAQTVDKAAGTDMWPTVREKHINPNKAGKKSEKDGHIYDNLQDGIGFVGLVRDTMLTTEQGQKYRDADMTPFIIETLSKSGRMADLVAQAMSPRYRCWQDLIFDFSLEGLFSFNDMLNAVLNNGSYNDESRFPYHYKLGLRGAADGGDVGSSVERDYGYQEDSDYDEEVLEDSGSSSAGGEDSGGMPVDTQGGDSDSYVDPSSMADQYRQTFGGSSDSVDEVHGDSEEDDQLDEEEDYPDEDDGTPADHSVWANPPQPPNLDIQQSLRNMASALTAMVIEDLDYSFTDAEILELETRTYDSLWKSVSERCE